MSKSDAEMDDELPSDSGNKVQESENKVEKEGEQLTPEFPISRDAVVSENGGEDVNKSRDEDDNMAKAKNEVKDEVIFKAETSEAIDASICEKKNPKSESAEPTDTKTSDQASPRIVVEKQMDAKDEGVEQNATNDNLAKEQLSDNSLGGGNNMKNVDEKTNENVKEKRPDEVGEVDVDNAGNIARGEKIIKSTDAENVSKDNRQLPIESSSNEAAEIKNAEIDPMENSEIPTAISAHKGPQNKNAENDLMEDKQLLTELSSNEAPPSIITENNQMENRQLRTELSANKDPQSMNVDMNEVSHDEEMEDAADLNKDKTVKDNLKEQVGETVLNRCATNENVMSVETAAKNVQEESSSANQHEVATPSSLVKNSPSKAENHSGETVKAVFTPTLPLMGESDDGTPEEQTAFMKEIESFYRERSMDFKPPKFYGKPLNCLKLWRAVIRLGGYDRVSGCKLWRQVGESFHPPKTCTTVSWTFRIFYEKSLLEYERHKTQTGELPLSVSSYPEASSADAEGNGYQGLGSGRARRDSAARAMQGWHAQRLFSSGEVGEPIIKDKNHNSTPKREKNLKSIGSVKQKRTDEVEHSNKAPRTEISRQLETPVVDVGPPADWVKINVLQNKDCYEIYALVPGLLREEVRVQTDPAGRVVITGQPEQVDNPWGITPFRKVVSLPSKIDPIQTSAVFSLHGRLLVRVPFEQHSDV